MSAISPGLCQRMHGGTFTESLGRYLSMADDHPTSPDALQQEIAAMEARLAELRRLADREYIAQSGTGGLAIGGTAGGEGSVVVGGDVRGHIYHVYQSAPGRQVLRQQDVERILGDYLHWVYSAYSKARLYGLESSPTARGRPVRALAEVFVHVTLRRVQPPRRMEVEERAKEMQGDAARAYLRLVEEKHQEGDSGAGRHGATFAWSKRNTGRARPCRSRACSPCMTAGP